MVEIFLIFLKRLNDVNFPHMKIFIDLIYLILVSKV